MEPVILKDSEWKNVLSNIRLIDHIGGNLLIFNGNEWTAWPLKSYDNDSLDFIAECIIKHKKAIKTPDEARFDKLKEDGVKHRERRGDCKNALELERLTLRNRLGGRKKKEKLAQDIVVQKSQILEDISLQYITVLETPKVQQSSPINYQKIQQPSLTQSSHRRDGYVLSNEDHKFCNENINKSEHVYGDVLKLSIICDTLSDIKNEGYSLHPEEQEIFSKLKLLRFGTCNH